MPIHLVKRNIPLVKQPTLIERKTLAGGFGTIQREQGSQKDQQATDYEEGVFHLREVVVFHLREVLRGSYFSKE